MLGSREKSVANAAVLAKREAARISAFLNMILLHISKILVIIKIIDLYCNYMNELRKNPDWPELVVGKVRHLAKKTPREPGATPTFREKSESPKISDRDQGDDSNPLVGASITDFRCLAHPCIDAGDILPLRSD